MSESFSEHKNDESSMSKPISSNDHDFSGNIPTHFEINLPSCFQQTFREREEQNIFNVEENEFNENDNFCVPNGHQQSEEELILKLDNPFITLQVNDIDYKIVDAGEKEEKKEKVFKVLI